MKPTSEQLEAVDLFRRGGGLRVNAFAGSGKTTTLRLLAESTGRRGLYLAFNRSIAADARSKFPSTVNCSTVHSLAFRATPSAYKHGDKMTGSMNANALAKHLSLEDAFVDGLRLTARSQGHLVSETLKRYMQGGRREPDGGHVPMPGKLGTLPEDRQEALRAETVSRARRIWARMREPSDPLPLGHDGYLKLWALSQPNLAADYILLDEAQDTNPVVLGVLGRQRAQVVYVGDRHQQIYEWRGAVNAMDLIQTEHSSHLTTSFRFGEVIAGAATRILDRLGEARPLVGCAGREGFLGTDDCDTILSRTNASVMGVVLSELERGRVPHVVGGTAEIIRMLRGVQDLKRGEPSEVAEFFGFASWTEVVEFSKTPEGEGLRTFVGLVEQHGENRLIVELDQTAQDERDADVVVSTAHKAKGREWDAVRLTEDFLPVPPRERPDGPEPEPDPSELRLFYVALTRARTAVEASPALLAKLGIAPGPRRPAVVRSSVPGKVVAGAGRRPAPAALGAAPPQAGTTPAAGAGLLRWWWVAALAGAAGYLLR